MKKLLLCISCLPLFVSAQNVYFSARLGLAGYHGELKPMSKPFSQMKFLKSIGAQYDLTEHIAARTYFTFTKLQGDDKRGTTAMKQRNLNFQTKLFDWEATAQYSFLSLNYHWWTPYIFTGVALYHYDPFTKDAENKKVYLMPLSTEGQGFQSKAYKKTQIGIPVGVGANYSLGEDIRVGLEFGYRILHNDYLDDVSNSYVDETSLRNARGQQAVDMAWRGGAITGNPYPAAGTARGNPVNKDGYYYVAVTFIVRYWFDKYKEIAGMPGGGGGGGKRVGCPMSRRRGN
jgi:opacity protein-like surface antigen